MTTQHLTMQPGGHLAIESDPLPTAIQEKIDALVFLAPIREAAIEANTRQALLEAAQEYYRRNLVPAADALVRRAGINTQPASRYGMFIGFEAEKKALRLISAESGTITPGRLRYLMGGASLNAMYRLTRILKDKNQIVLMHKRYYAIKEKQQEIIS